MLTRQKIESRGQITELERERGETDAISRGGQSGRRGKYKSNPSRQKAAVVKYGLACRIRGSSRNSALD